MAGTPVLASNMVTRNMDVNSTTIPLSLGTDMTGICFRDQLWATASWVSTLTVSWLFGDQKNEGRNEKPATSSPAHMRPANFVRQIAIRIVAIQGFSAVTGVRRPAMANGCRPRHRALMFDSRGYGHPIDAIFSHSANPKSCHRQSHKKSTTFSADHHHRRLFADRHHRPTTSLLILITDDTFSLPIVTFSADLLPSQTMAVLVPFSHTEKTSHNSHKFGFTLSPTNYGYWKAMVQPFLVTNNLFGYVDGTIPCLSPTISSTTSSGKDKEDTIVFSHPNPLHAIWVANDAYVRMLILSTVSEASFQHVQGTTSRDLWLSLERAYAPHTSSREYTLKTQLLKISMKGDESSSTYLTRAQEYSDALANIGEPMKEKDLVMLVILGLCEEYNGLKSTLLARQFPTAFSELHGLLSDHDFMIKKTAPDADALQAIQQLATQLGLHLQPSPSPPAQSYYTNRAGNNRNRGSNNRFTNNRGRSTSNNRNQGGGARNQFSWASNQNTVFGTCNRCGIGHLPSHCPNRDPATVRPRHQPSANFAAPSTWLPDTGSSQHVSQDLSGMDSSKA
ncbi:hypothetical protein E3N88_22417 [Mikania micrantha]|uniref:Retrotransposon Copia-like N-terminal domain-containing protein n=1 Tax=Mikania micrantha TaxID=192012 RepID=A0A5N6NAB0_9ASTR|nr:hypothetical protein E3N88_22417 [Mikania micrantha]